MRVILHKALTYQEQESKLAWRRGGPGWGITTLSCKELLVVGPPHSQDGNHVVVDDPCLGVFDGTHGMLRPMFLLQREKEAGRNLSFLGPSAGRADLCCLSCLLLMFSQLLLHGTQLSESGGVSSIKLTLKGPEAV